MDETLIHALVKSRLDITGDFRDAYLTAIIGGVLDELHTQNGIVLEADNQSHLMFVVDFSVYRYQMRDSGGDMPMHLQARLRELYITSRGTTHVHP